jgi:DNA (cytosine-5)-methyltransferase 1
VLSFASLFAGIGGFDLGLERAGLRCVLQVERDANAIAVLAAHWPHVTRRGDIRDTVGEDLVRARADVVVGGFPCQETSRATFNRRGLAGVRSGLFWELHRVLGEAHRLDAERPRWVVIENPPGLLTSAGGRDLAAVAGGLEDLGYGWAYRVVDSRFLAAAGRRSPQRRPRVVLVGHRGGDPRPPGQVLGLLDPGGQAPSASGECGATSGPAVGLGPVGPEGAVIFRKSARAKTALERGGFETWVPAVEANTLTGNDGGGPTRQTHLVVQRGRVRTLTLLEWERLCGLPDHWTAMVTDSARFKTLGNIAHPALTEWLGRRLVAVA